MMWVSDNGPLKIPNIEVLEMSPAVACPEPKNAIAPALYRVDDVAQLLQCSTRNIWKLSDAGAMPELVRVGRLVRWRVKDIDTWISSGCARPK
jgi:excisionase family DNA binding protein